MKNRNCLKHAGLLAVAALLLLALAACARPTTGGDVMASVNGHKIYRTEVKDAPAVVLEILAQQRARLQALRAAKGDYVKPTDL